MDEVKVSWFKSPGIRPYLNVLLIVLIGAGLFALYATGKRIGHEIGHSEGEDSKLSFYESGLAKGRAEGVKFHEDERALAVESNVALYYVTVNKETNKPVVNFRFRTVKEISDADIVDRVAKSKAVEVVPILDPPKPEVQQIVARTPQLINARMVKAALEPKPPVDPPRVPAELIDK